ncbi:MAG: SIR2 family protein [Methanosarcinales archaeon]|nr:SIR2 family protein [Methanosarcinales archaeon]
MELENIERVFIFGAGVSAHCGYPLTDNLLKEITLNLKSNDKDRFHINKFIEAFYPNFNLSYFNYPNIEDVLSLLDVAIELESEIPSTRYSYYFQDVSEIKNKILINIYNNFFEKLDKVNEDMAIYKFAYFLKPNDVIITFNWDLNLEKALKKLNKKYVYYLDNNVKERITILKLHGSINWFKRNENKFKTEKKEPLIKGIGNNEVDVFKYLRKPNTIKKDIVPYIVPPTIKKSIDSEELQIIWKDGYNALSHAKEINILGYSLPDIDLNSRYIFRSAIRENDYFKTARRKKRQFLIVNPNDSVYTTYRNLVGDPIQFEQAKFEDLNFKNLFK